jgi:hypothetical protein
MTSSRNPIVEEENKLLKSLVFCFRSLIAFRSILTAVKTERKTMNGREQDTKDFMN